MKGLQIVSILGSFACMVNQFWATSKQIERLHHVGLEAFGWAKHWWMILTSLPIPLECLSRAECADCPHLLCWRSLEICITVHGSLDMHPLDIVCCTTDRFLLLSRLVCPWSTSRPFKCRSMQLRILMRMMTHVLKGNLQYQLRRGWMELLQRKANLCCQILQWKMFRNVVKLKGQNNKDHRRKHALGRNSLLLHLTLEANNQQLQSMSMQLKLPKSVLQKFQRWQIHRSNSTWCRSPAQTFHSMSMRTVRFSFIFVKMIWIVWSSMTLSFTMMSSSLKRTMFLTMMLQWNRWSNNWRFLTAPRSQMWALRNWPDSMVWQINLSFNVFRSSMCWRIHQQFQLGPKCWAQGLSELGARSTMLKANQYGSGDHVLLQGSLHGWSQRERASSHQPAAASSQGSFPLSS